MWGTSCLCTRSMNSRNEQQLYTTHAALSVCLLSFVTVNCDMQSSSPARGRNSDFESLPFNCVCSCTRACSPVAGAGSPHCSSALERLDLYFAFHTLPSGPPLLKEERSNAVLKPLQCYPPTTHSDVPEALTLFARARFVCAW